MKKLILGASMFIGVVVQAATVTWTSGTIYTAKDDQGGFSTTGIKNAATAYLFALTDAQYQSFEGAFAKSGNMSAVWGAYSGKLESCTVQGNSSSMGSGASLKTEGSVGETVYAAIIYQYTDSKYGDMYIANIGTATIGSEMGVSVGNLASYYLGDEKGTPTGGWVPGGTDPAPEPTSSMLLLLGAAGLALRRRRV